MLVPVVSLRFFSLHDRPIFLTGQETVGEEHILLVSSSCGNRGTNLLCYKLHECDRNLHLYDSDVIQCITTQL